MPEVNIVQSLALGKILVYTIVYLCLIHLLHCFYLLGLEQ